MQSLMQKKKAQITESLIKESLLCQLSYSVKEVQLEYSQANTEFTTNEACNSLVVTMEAIFLHGLKKGIIQRALKSIGGAEESRPQPSFWPVVSSYTHKDTLSTIKKLSQINTDVGRCRVWLRIAFNETEITSYFHAMEKERRPLNSFYNNYAFLRDRETCDTACKLLEGIIPVKFNIPINANILNTWNSEPLMLSGIWSPPLKIPVSVAVDVAEGIEVEADDDDTFSVKTSSSMTTLSTVLALDESQALKMILDAPLNEKEVINAGNMYPSLRNTHSSDEPIQEDAEYEEVKPEAEEMDRPCMGNSLSNAAGWSSSEIEQREVPENDTWKQKALLVKDEEPKTFSGLLESYGHSPRDERNYKNILQQFSEKQVREKSEENSDYEIVTREANDYEELLFKIVREKGLKAQNYTCSNCQLSIGLNFDEARFCHFSGKYFCKNCHINDTHIIPSRLIHNWDHKKYPVCGQAYSYLVDIFNTLLIDIKKVNPKLYSVVSEMQEMKNVRFRLNLLRAYLYTCRKPVILDLQKRVWPRDYLCEHIHTYTMSDLCKVPGGTLAAELNAVVTFARDHVLCCWLCSQKGFICEICRDPKVVYPFDCGSTYRCGKCYSVYHGGCLSSSRNCPKCMRVRQRTAASATEEDSD